MTLHNTIKQYRLAFREVKKHTPRLVTITILQAILNAVYPFINIYFSARIIDCLSSSQEVKQLVTLVLILLFLNFVLFTLGNYFKSKYELFRTLLWHKEKNAVAQALNQTEYQNLEDASFQESVQKHASGIDSFGSFLNRVVWQLGELIKGIVLLCLSIFFIFPLIKVSLKNTGGSFFESPWFLIVIALGIGVSAGVIALVSAKLQKRYFKLYDQCLAVNKIQKYYFEKLSNYKTGKEIRMFHEEELIERHAEEILLNKGNKLFQKMTMNNAILDSTYALLGVAMGFIIYVFIGVKGLLGLFSVGYLVQYIGSFLQIVSAIGILESISGQVEIVVNSLKYYTDIIQSAKREPNQSALIPKSPPYQIEFRNVSFKYPNMDQYALKNISLTLPFGEQLAIVGRNGSGKTTFIKLLCRLYTVDEGEILLNGININDYKEEEYFKLFSVVFQDYSIFSFTVQQNISGNKEDDGQKLKSCLNKAGILERVEAMADKENTYLYSDYSEDGVEISGGEAQKIALARALYKDAPFIILDEPTSALDPLAEYDLYQKFNQLVEGKTAIYISHRLSSCKFCKHIAVFNDGELLQYGSHDDLIKDTDGKYFELWNAQAQYYLTGQKLTQTV